jgi:hypothetical protein
MRKQTNGFATVRRVAKLEPLGSLITPWTISFTSAVIRVSADQKREARCGKHFALPRIPRPATVRSVQTIGFTSGITTWIGMGLGIWPLGCDGYSLRGMLGYFVTLLCRLSVSVSHASFGFHCTWTTADKMLSTCTRRILTPHSRRSLLACSGGCQSWLLFFRSGCLSSALLGAVSIEHYSSMLSAMGFRLKTQSNKPAAPNLAIAFPFQSGSLRRRVGETALSREADCHPAFATPVPAAGVRRF